MQAVTEGKFDEALNDHYSNCGYEWPTLAMAKRHLKAGKFKEIDANVYRNDKYRTAFLASLQEGELDLLSGEVTFKAAGWLITYSGNEPISHNDCAFSCKRQ